MESFGDFSLSLVALAALIPGIVQTVKELLGWEGNKARALTMFTGMFFGGLFYAVDQSLIPEVYHAWIKLAVFTLASGPAAMGYYTLILKPIRSFSEPLDTDARYNLTSEGCLYANDADEPVRKSDIVTVCNANGECYTLNGDWRAGDWRPMGDANEVSRD